MGANALAGLIALRSQSSDSTAREISVGIESYGGNRLSARLGGALSVQPMAGSPYSAMKAMAMSITNGSAGATPTRVTNSPPAARSLGNWDPTPSRLPGTHRY